MISRRLAVTTLMLVGIFVAFGMDSHSYAAAPKPSKRPIGITISPAFQDITLLPSMANETFTISVTNNTSEPYEFSLSVVDFGSLDESGGVLFAGQTERKLNYRYGLSQWATVERDRIVVEPKATEKVPVTIINKESLSPGGHYGALLLSPTNSGERPTKVQINQVLSSLLFVKKQGGEIYNLSLRDYKLQQKIFQSPDSLELRFQNAGNVHVVPRGIVTVTDLQGRVVKKGSINAGSALALPETFRRMTVPLDSMASSWMPGKYQVSIQYRFDGTDSFQTRTFEYFYLSVWYVAVLISLVILGIAMAVHRNLRRHVFRVVKSPVKLVQKIFRRRPKI